MSRAEYPNRDALRDANDIYLDTMRPFIIHHLKQVQGEKVENLIEDALDPGQADKFWEKLDEDDDIESAIDFSYFPQIIQRQWKDAFGQRFNWDLNFQSMLWLIRKGRNSCEHRGKKDLDSEFVRINLFLIADVLGKINRPDEQREVEAIRDELFYDDSAERLEKAEKRLKDLESEKSETAKRLADTESEKKEYEQKNAALSKQVDEKENQRKKLDKQLKRAKTQNDKYKKDIAGTKQRLEESEAAQTDYKNRLETTLKDLEDAKKEWQACEDSLRSTSDRLEEAVEEWVTCVERLTAMQGLFTIATIDNREVQAIFPPIKTDSPVRILDRRGVDKKNYLLVLLEQKQPTIIYVQSEEMADLLLERVVPEKADLIEKHSEQTSETEEREILERLKNGEKIAVVSNTAFSKLTPPYHVEHFIFCHLAPGLDAFFKQCEPAFTSKKNCYLHFIYNSKQDIEGLAQKYPDREVLEKLYPELRKLAGTNGDLIRPESVYNELDIAKPGIETGLAIFQELQLLERNDEGIRLLPPTGKKLGESGTYCRGEKLKKETEDFRDFQYEQPVEKIWEEILEKLDMDSEQILREVSTDEMYSGVSEMENDLQPTEIVEDDNQADEEDTETSQASEPTRANAAEHRSSIVERYVTETTEAERNELAVKVVELRINATGSRGLSWREIREKLGLHNDQFHKVIRLSDGYRNAVIERIKSLKSAEGGWEYNGKLSVLTGIEDIESDLK